MMEAIFTLIDHGMIRTLRITDDTRMQNYPSLELGDT